MPLMRRTAHALIGPVLMVGLAACNGYVTLSDGDAKPGGIVGETPTPTSVMVPIVEGIAGRDYESTGIATLTNDEYADGNVLGTVTIRATTGTPNPSTNSHFFTATVMQTNGVVVTCAESRSHIWSAFDVPEDIPLPCEADIDLRAKGVVRLSG